MELQTLLNQTLPYPDRESQFRENSRSSIPIDDGTLKTSNTPPTTSVPFVKTINPTTTQKNNNNSIHTFTHTHKMKSLISLPLLLLLTPNFFSSTVQAGTDYFFRFAGGNAITASQRLRSNLSATYSSPGVTPAPHNPSDHFRRIYTNSSVPSSSSSSSSSSAEVLLYVVPTNPHPPPVPGYYGLSVLDGIPDAYRLVYSYRVEEEGERFLYKGWELRLASSLGSGLGGGGGGSGVGSRVLLRYAGDVNGEWRWIAVKEATFDGGEKWVPWYVKPSARNVQAMSKWEYVVVDLELVEAGGRVNSGAPGGEEEGEEEEED